MRDRTEDRTRGLRLGVRAAAVVALTSGLLLAGGGSTPPARAACDIAIGPGKWTGSFNLNELVVPDGFPQRATTTTTGTLDLILACDGTLSGSFAIDQMIVTTLTRNMGPSVPKRRTCRSSGEHSVTKGALDGRAGVGLAIELQGRVQPGAIMRCDPAIKGVPKPRGVVGLRLVATAVEPGLISGGAAEWTSKEMRDRTNSGTVTVTGGQWQLSGGPPPPVISGVTSQYERYFFEGEGPALNRFTARVAWADPSEPGSATFELGGQTLPGTPEGDGGSVSAIFDLGALARTSRLTVTATDQWRAVATDASLQVVIVPRPSWATPIAWDPRLASAIVVYQGRLEVPERPIDDLAVTIDPRLPVLGGRWGLQPTQLIVNLAADSAANPLPAQVRGTGGPGARRPERAPAGDRDDPVPARAELARPVGRSDHARPRTPAEGREDHRPGVTATDRRAGRPLGRQSPRGCR